MQTWAPQNTEKKIRIIWFSVSTFQSHTAFTLFEKSLFKKQLNWFFFKFLVSNSYQILSSLIIITGEGAEGGEGRKSQHRKEEKEELMANTLECLLCTTYAFHSYRRNIIPLCPHTISWCCGHSSYCSKCWTVPRGALS